MTEIPIPSEWKKLSKKHILTEVIICVLTVLSVQMLLVPPVLGVLVLVLGPVAFAYPMIVSRPKLLYIAAGMAVVWFIVLVLLSGYDIYVSLLLLLLFVVVSALGLVAGLLIRHFRKSRKRVKVLAITGGIIVLLVPLLFFAEIFGGVFRSPFVHLRIRTYVARNYADFDLNVNWSSYYFDGNMFSAQISDRNNPDIYFYITHGSGELRDGFTSGSFWEKTLNYMITPLLEEEFDGEFYRDTPWISGVQDGFTSRVEGVQIGQPFDKTADVEKTARIIVITESAAPEALAAMILRYHEFFTQNGFNFTAYIFHFRYAHAPPIREVEQVIDIRVVSELINDDLPTRIEYGRNNRNENGVFHTTEFRYVSLMDLEPANE